MRAYRAVCSRPERWASKFYRVLTVATVLLVAAVAMVWPTVARVL